MTAPLFQMDSVGPVRYVQVSTGAEVDAASDLVVEYERLLGAGEAARRVVAIHEDNDSRRLKAEWASPAHAVELVQTGKDQMPTVWGDLLVDVVEAVQFCGNENARPHRRGVLRFEVQAVVAAS